MPSVIRIFFHRAFVKPTLSISTAAGSNNFQKSLLNVRKNYSTSSMSGELVLVSGASGFIASWICKKLQERGFRVRGTVRSLKNAQKTEYLRNLCPDAKYPIELVEAELLNAEGWPAAVKDCKYVMHTASPFVFGKPNHPDDLIKPAVEGTLNVLKAASEAGTVERVVLTSSYAAVVESGRKEGAFTDGDWSVPEKQGNIYMRSKTLAEKAAWDFVKELPHGKKFQLCTIMPSAVFGPPLSNNSSESIESIAGMFEGKVPMVPKLTVNAVDVRDVSEAHVRCITTDDAAGKRFILDGGKCYYPDVVHILSEEFTPQGYKLPQRQMPTTLLKIASCFSAEAKDMRTLGEHPKDFDTSLLRNTLGIEPITLKKTLHDMVYALIENGRIKKTDKYRGPPQAEAANAS